MQEDSLEKASRQFDIITMVEPNNAEAYYNRGLCKELMKKYESIVQVPKKSSSPPLELDPPSGDYELQIGAFQVQGNAQLMQKKLETNGYKARILELISRSNTTWYLVRTGVYTRQEEADSLKIILKKE